MSTRRTYMIETTEIVRIQTMTNEDLFKTEESIKEMVKEKLNRLKMHLHSCDVTMVQNILVIKDTLGVTNELKQILESYGLLVKQVNHMLDIDAQGNIYIVKDLLMDTYTFIQRDHKQLNNLVESVIRLNDTLHHEMTHHITKLKGMTQTLLQADMFKNQEIIQILDAAKSQTSLNIEEKKRLRVTEDDGVKIYEETIQRTDNTSKYNHAQQLFNTSLSKLNLSHKSNMMNGTTKSLEIRAKKMGYTVSKKKNGNQVQLVLVRER